MTDDRKPLWPWIAALLIGLPALYALSVGPVFSITGHEVLLGDEGPHQFIQRGSCGYRSF
jgi:hypothetical protein